MVQLFVAIAQKKIWHWFLPGDEFADGGDFISKTLKQEKIKTSFFFTGRVLSEIDSFATIISQLKNRRTLSWLRIQINICCTATGVNEIVCWLQKKNSLLIWLTTMLQWPYMGLLIRRLLFSCHRMNGIMTALQHGQKKWDCNLINFTPVQEAMQTIPHPR